MNPKSPRAPFWKRLFGGRVAAGDIFSAIERGNVEKCREFLRGNPAVLGRTDELGRSPLHVAAHEGCDEIVALLIAAGADVHARDPESATPLHWAAVGGHLPVIEKLLAAGADIQAVDKHGFTASQLAEMRGHPAVAEFLRRRGRTSLDRSA